METIDRVKTFQEGKSIAATIVVATILTYAFFGRKQLFWQKELFDQIPNGQCKHQINQKGL